MKRRDFIAAVGVASIGWPSGGSAQQPDRVRRIGALLTVVDSQLSDAFIRELEKFGWIEGRNIHIEWRFHAGDPDRMRAYAAELVGLSPDVILATSPIEAKVLRQETSVFPIVFAAGVDPVSQGVVDSLAHPGGNITGCSTFEFSLGGKWVQSLREIAPNVRRIGIVFNPQTAPYIESIVHSIEAAAAPARVTISAIPVLDVAELERAVASWAQEPDGAVIFAPDVSLSAKVKAAIVLVARYRLPAVYAVPAYAKFGGLLAYGPDFLDNYRRAARLIDRILKGARPSDLPIEQPTRFVLAINLKTAKQLGLDVVPSLLAQADEVIE
jgi:putative tryptophan/tyrosine transport system substrate-binding protein